MCVRERERERVRGRTPGKYGAAFLAAKARVVTSSEPRLAGSRRQGRDDVAVSGDLARFDLCCQPSTRRPQAYSLNCQRSTYSKGHGGQKRASQVGQTVTAPRKPLETSTRQIEDIGRERHTSASPSAWKESQRKGSMPFQPV